MRKWAAGAVLVRKSAGPAVGLSSALRWAGSLAFRRAWRSALRWAERLGAHKGRASSALRGAWSWALRWAWSSVFRWAHGLEGQESGLSKGMARGYPARGEFGLAVGRTAALRWAEVLPCDGQALGLSSQDELQGPLSRAGMLRRSATSSGFERLVPRDARDTYPSHGSRFPGRRAGWVVSKGVFCPYGGA